MRTRRLLASAMAIVSMLLLVSSGPAPWRNDTPAEFVRLGGPAPAIAGISTPPLGWNSWNTLGCAIGEQTIRAQADAMVASGLRDAGYRYVVVDDCWFDPERDTTGRLRGDPIRFPSGMHALGDYLHALGLKFGLYETPGVMTCAQRGGSYPGATGSVGHETVDAQTFADWGVDYLKYDWCTPDIDATHQIRAFTVMRDAIRRTGAPILYSINPNSYVPTQTPGRSIDWGGIATMARVTQDVLQAWRLEPNGPLSPTIGIEQAITQTGPLGARTGSGFWNDPDMLVIGVLPRVGATGLSKAEARTQFGMWAMMSAPLIAGNDLTRMPRFVSRLLANRAVLAVDQDPSPPAVQLNERVWSRRLADGSTVLALYNADSATQSITVSPGGGVVTDLWTGSSEPITGSLTRTVRPHDTLLLRLTPS